MDFLSWLVLSEVLFSLQVTLDKYKPEVRTVVVKTDRIDDKWYAVQLQILAGNTSLVTTAWENDIPFRIDMASV